MSDENSFIVNSMGDLVEKTLASITSTWPDAYDEKILKRFFSKVKKEQPNGCWMWVGSTTSRGYGSFWINGFSFLAHRASYLLHKGDIDGEFFVCHKCDNPLCVNPDHLFTGTSKDNLVDCYSKDRRPSARSVKLRTLIKSHIRPDSSPTKIGYIFGVDKKLISRYKKELYGPRKNGK